MIGAGVTFQLPGSLDQWGVMCEGDLEEVYSFRSLNYKYLKTSFIGLTGVFAATGGLAKLLSLGTMATAGVGIGLTFALMLIIHLLQIKPSSQRQQEIADCLLEVAERSAPLSLRMDNSSWPIDETGETALWINSFLDRTEASSNTLAQVATIVSAATEDLSQLTQKAMSSSLAQRNAALNTAQEVDRLIENIAKGLRSIRVLFNIVPSSSCLLNNQFLTHLSSI